MTAQVPPPPPPAPPAAAPSAPAPGQFEVSEEAAERALERTLVATGNLVVPQGFAEFEPFRLVTFVTGLSPVGRRSRPQR
jgi:hypothetical protein